MMIINNLYILLFAAFPLAVIIGPTISTTLVALIIILFLFNCFIKKDFKIFFQKELIILYFLYAYLIFNLLISIDIENSSPRNIGFLRHILLVGATIYLINNFKNYEKLFLIWSLILSIVVFDIYVEFFYGKNLLGYSGSEGYWGNRVVSFFKNEQIVGGFVYSFSIVLLGFLFQFNKKKFKLLNFIVPLIFLVAILITGERANFLKSLIGVILFFIITKEINLKKKLIFFILILITTFFAVNSSKYLKTRFEGQFLTNFKTFDNLKGFYDNSLYFKHYRGGYKVFKDNKIFGVGNKNFGQACYEKFNYEYKYNKNLNYVCSTHPHQIYMELISEHGIVGLIVILLCIFYLLIKNIFIYLNFKNNLHLGTIIYVLLNFLPLIPTGSFFTNLNSTIFWLIFSLMIAIGKKISR